MVNKNKRITEKRTGDGTGPGNSSGTKNRTRTGPGNRTDNGTNTKTGIGNSNSPDPKTGAGTGARTRTGTSTSPFGTPGKISHDSSAFYRSRLYEGQKAPGPNIEYLENKIDPANLNRIYCQTAELMAELPDYSVHLMVTSPPYNARKEYDDDLSLAEYRALLRRVFQETYKKLVTGGRACINIANLGRKPYLPLHAYLIADLLEMGFLMRGEIIWNKAASASPSTAWGSWLSASNPVLRDVHEYILIFCKETFSRKRGNRENTLQKEDFLEWTKSVWNFPAVSAKSIGHPAPFPEELPRRLIQLYTFREEVVLDPFCGSGTTCLAARKNGRNYVGYEINPDYAALALKRLRENSDQPELVENSGLPGLPENSK